jgi:beta-N-acetylhexosaminidase
MNEKIKNIISGMTLREKVGQMFIARYPTDGKYNREEAVEKYHLGGFTWYAENFKDETPESIRADVNAQQAKSKIPLFMAVDEEGGRVCRISCYPQFRYEAFKSPSALYAEGGIERCVADTKEKAEFLLDLGFNLNFAPVCDMTYSPENYIHHRTLGQDVDTTCKYVSAVVKQMNESRLGCSIKHFPGYGDNVDTHQFIAHDDRSLDDFMKADIFPFRAGIEAGAGIIMVAHNIVKGIDPDTPESLSPEAHRLIREELGFGGVIMTDSLDMGGITRFVGEKSAAVMAVTSGNDMLCCTSYPEQIEAIIEAINSGEITEERIDESVYRILKLKAALGIINL